jgi:hypothetical protein
VELGYYPPLPLLSGKWPVRSIFSSFYPVVSLLHRHESSSLCTATWLWPPAVARRWGHARPLKPHLSVCATPIRSRPSPHAITGAPRHPRRPLPTTPYQSLVGAPPRLSEPHSRCLAPPWLLLHASVYQCSAVATRSGPPGSSAWNW